MLRSMRWTTSLAVLICLTACTTGKPDTPSALIGEATLCGRTVSHGQTLADVPVEGVEFVLKFTRDVAPTPVGDLYFSGGDVSVERGADSRALREFMRQYQPWSSICDKHYRCYFPDFARASEE